MPDLFRFQVTEEYEDERIDKYMASLIDSLSRSFIQKMMKEQKVLVNNIPVKANYRLRAEDEICFTLPEAAEPDIEAENIPLDILYEDDDVLVVNKPKGMVVHPAAGHYSGTLVNAVMYHCRGIAAQLKDHTIVRRYRAIVHGVIREEELCINSPVGRHPTDRKKMAAGVRNGKEAVTHIKVLERFRAYTYIECRLETGRTHQIRVHMDSIGHPLLGDTVYGNRKYSLPYVLQGQTLHAMTLGFIHPVSGEYVETTAPLPDYFSHLLETLPR